jgi:hypothetical protein
MANFPGVDPKMYEEVQQQWVQQQQQARQQEQAQRFNWLERECESFKTEKGYWNESFETAVLQQIEAIKATTPGRVMIDPIGVLKEAESRAKRLASSAFFFNSAIDQCTLKGYSRSGTGQSKYAADHDRRFRASPRLPLNHRTELAPRRRPRSR